MTIFMSKVMARNLYTYGRSHALAADRLYRAAIEDGHERSPDDPESFAFNGPYSLSIYYLPCLGLELLLKAAYLASDGSNENKELLRIGHDLNEALRKAEEQGFQSNAPQLREIVNLLCEPYKAHKFRYDMPNELPLPDFVQVIGALEVLDGELKVLCEDNN
jgi:hypothetical protein